VGRSKVPGGPSPAPAAEVACMAEARQRGDPLPLPPCRPNRGGRIQIWSSCSSGSRARRGSSSSSTRVGRRWRRTKCSPPSLGILGGRHCHTHLASARTECRGGARRPLQPTMAWPHAGTVDPQRQKVMTMVTVTSSRR
jgi:hypothetical protein